MNYVAGDIHLVPLPKVGVKYCKIMLYIYIKSEISIMSHIYFYNKSILFSQRIGLEYYRTICMGRLITQYTTLDRESRVYPKHKFTNKTMCTSSWSNITADRTNANFNFPSNLLVMLYQYCVPMKYAYRRHVNWA